MRSRDDDIQLQFDALRRADAASAPALDEVMDRPIVMHRRPAILAFAGIVAAALVILIVRSPSLGAPPLEVSIEPDTPSLLTWQSPTASLLEPRGAELVGPSPTVTSSLLRRVLIDSRTFLSTGR